MSISEKVFRFLKKRVMNKREPDFVVNDKYLNRWYLVPRNRFFNIYLHRFQESDDDRALHDHPWFWCSFLLDGMYIEHSENGYWHYWQGSIRFHRPTYAHRLEVPFGKFHPVVTLFITGPRVRTWGFHTDDGWVPYYEFLNLGQEEYRRV